MIQRSRFILSLTFVSFLVISLSSPVMAQGWLKKGLAKAKEQGKSALAQADSMKKEITGQVSGTLKNADVKPGNYTNDEYGYTIIVPEDWQGTHIENALSITKNMSKRKKTAGLGDFSTPSIMLVADPKEKKNEDYACIEKADLEKIKSDFENSKSI